MLDAFWFESRNGTMIILEGTSDLPYDRRLAAKVYAPGKEVREVTAIKDRVHPLSPTQTSSEGFLLVGIDQLDLGNSTLVEINCDAT